MEDEERQSFSLHVTIPINTTATVDLPTANSSSVKESEQAIADHPEIKSVTGNDGATQYEIGSGNYHFTCAMK